MTIVAMASVVGLDNLSSNLQIIILRLSENKSPLSHQPLYI